MYPRCTQGIAVNDDDRWNLNRYIANHKQLIWHNALPLGIKKLICNVIVSIELSISTVDWVWPH